MKAKRFTTYTKENAPQESVEFFDSIEKSNGFIPNLFYVLAGSPQALESYLILSKINAKTTLKPIEREIVQMVSGVENGCGFCIAAHTKASEKVRMSEEDIKALRENTDLQDTKLNALAKYTRTVMRNKGNVSDEDLQEFISAGYTEINALEVNIGIGLATISNFSNNLAQTVLNQEFEAYKWDKE